MQQINEVSGVDGDTLRRRKPRLGWRDSTAKSVCGGVRTASADEPGMFGAQVPTAQAAHRFGPTSLTEAEPVQLRPHFTF